MALRRQGAVVGLLVLGLAACLHSDRITAESQANERTISFYHIHTQERLTIAYKRDGKYIPEAMKQINWIMRDWRKNEVITIDPKTIDLAWEMHEELGSKEPINIICGYRSRGTNEMLRRTRGGQASQSQHITGKAIDITFPDVPLKRMRYSALIRERGGVGYYPTSGIPFVHIDTAWVRAWPRLPRYELALLFPNGKTQHRPAEGGSISPGDVKVAQNRFKELATQVAQFFHDRLTPGNRTAIASADKPATATQFTVASGNDAGTKRQISLTWEPIGGAKPKAEEPKPFATASAAGSGLKLASFSPDDENSSAPKPAIGERSSKLSPSLNGNDRGKLNSLVTAAASMRMPELLSGPKPAVRPQKGLADAALAENQPAASAPARPAARVASLTPEASGSQSITDMSPDSLGNGWVQAPAFDEDHPEELAYRPFPLAPLLTDTPSPHDPGLAGLQHPDVAATLDMLDDDGSIAPMRFRPGRQLAEVIWAQQFQGKAVHLEALLEIDQGKQATTRGIENRAVTSAALSGSK